MLILRAFWQLSCTLQGAVAARVCTSSSGPRADRQAPKQLQAWLIKGWPSEFEVADIPGYDSLQRPVNGNKGEHGQRSPHSLGSDGGVSLSLKTARFWNRHWQCWQERKIINE